MLQISAALAFHGYWRDVSDIVGPAVKPAVDRFLGVFRRQIGAAAADRQVDIVETADL